MKYPKIDSIYKRYRKNLHNADGIPYDKKYNDFIDGEYSTCEFEALKDAIWIWKEKFDGTNIRLYIDRPDEDTVTMKVAGRTNNAEIPRNLLKWINQWFESKKDKLMEMFNTDIILYGEGVGEKIQSGGLYGHQHFKLFDVFIDNWWLKEYAVKDIGASLEFDTPLHWSGTIDEAISLVKTHPKSEYGDFVLEGYVGTPMCGLKDRNGKRIITKIKVKDFR
jgi:hypothetical protein